MAELTYIRVGDYDIPNLVLDPEPEELKARDQMAWIGLVNNCKAQVEEILFSDLIYV